MNDFFKRNLVWVAILLCIAGVVLSIIGIPAGNPIFFFIGIILSLPTIGYLVYQVFFYREKAELDLSPTSAKFSSSNITSIVADRSEVLLNDEISNEDDLEPLYNGYANDQEIAKRLHEVTATERERAMIELPEINLPEAESNFDSTAEIQNTTQDELFRQREVAVNAPTTFSTEVPAEIETPLDLETEEYAEVIEENLENTQPISYAVETIEEPEPVTENDEPYEFVTEQPTEETEEPESISEYVQSYNDIPERYLAEEEYIAPSLDDPNYIESTDQYIMNEIPLNQPTQKNPNLATVDLTNAKIVHIDAEKIEQRKQKAQEKKALLSQDNLERYLKRYFVETAACFLMDRTIYKDKNGIAPYNKFAVNKATNLPEYSMSSTKGRLYKFCTYLIDAERFITHPVIYDDFITEIEQGVSLARISETLHPLYRRKYKKDFILNLSNREDWDNVMILVYNNYILNNDNFKNVFTHIPFEIPFAFNTENIIDYLKDPDLQERFAEKFLALEEMGIPTFWDALYICFINSIKQKLTIEQLENAVLREYKKVVRALKRADNIRRKSLKKAS